MAGGGGGGGSIDLFIESVPSYVFNSPDVLTTTDNVLIPWIPGRSRKVDGATAQVKTAPATQDIIIAVKLIDRATGAVISTLGMIVIPVGTLQGTISFGAITVLTTQALAAEITQVGVGPAGANLTVEVYGPSSSGSGGGVAESLETARLVGATFSGDVYWDASSAATFGKSFGQADQDYLRIFSDKTNHLQVIDSDKDGAGVIRPMSFQMGGVEKMGLSTAGVLSVPAGVVVSGGGSITVSGGGQVNTNTLSVLVATNTMSFVSTGGAFSFDGPISMTTSTSLYLDSTDGTAAALSPASHGRLLYNNTTKTWQVSMDGSAYASIVTGAGGGNTLTQSYNQGGAGAGRVITVDSGPVAFTGSGTPGTPGHMLVDGSQTIASAAGATWKAASFAPGVTVSGVTNITTAAGFNMIELAAPTISAGSALTVTNSATLTILGAPVGGGAGPATITNKYAFWVQAGTTRFPAGTTSLPSVTLQGDNTTGWFTDAADTWKFTASAGWRLTLSASVLQVNPNGNGVVFSCHNNDTGAPIIKADPVGNANFGIVSLGTTKTNVNYFATGSFGAGLGVIFIGNAQTNPSSNPVGGGILYSNAGGLTWRGSGGTTTPIAPAGPHCEVCGYDAWTVASLNMRWKSWHFSCGHCGADYRGGPEHVHDRLDDVQKSEYIRKGMVFEDVMKVMNLVS